MLKNFSPKSLGINGRQSELIELALTYGFRSMDIDMYELLRRSQRTSADDAAKFLRAALGEGMGRLEAIGGFPLEIDMDADDDAFTSQVGALHPLTELAADLGVTRAYIMLPASTDRLPYHEYFENQQTRLGQIAEVLGAKDIQLGVGFNAEKKLAKDKQFDFVRNVEGLIAIVKAVGNPQVGYVIDTWDWVVGDGGMDQLSEIAGSEIVAVRLGTVAEDADPANLTRADRVLPTLEGTLNHVSVVKQLASAGFEGPISPSASPMRYKGQTRENTVKEAQEAIDAICTEAGVEVKPLPMDLIEDIPVEPTPVA
ncbi:TIM barrel protein [Roseiconus nitratireducens]|uniref:TIM barrel protein n=1 Tax=Roseiconus nitratireducens TaxID=2605748 RepID=A0A5M6D9C1_9BACT|nr:TIM barrel protein [Roseiconus nitratireducens]KAA5543226.1 TIM barrel protein [Roseiconus nitratireducens]